jgi:hypothetical protein
VQAGGQTNPAHRRRASQSVKSAGPTEESGYDAGKKSKGRKRHLLVDTLGLVLGVLVTAANEPDRQGTETLLIEALSPNSWLRLLWGDGSYSGPEYA